MSAGFFLFIKHSSETLSRRLYLERFGNELFLQWWLKRFRSRHPGISLGIIATSRAEGLRILRSQLCPPWAGVIPNDRVNKTAALVDAATARKCAGVAICSIEYAFAPPGILGLALAHHRRYGNNYTLVTGLPVGVAPEIFNVEVLVSVLRLGLPNLPSEPSGVLEHLRWVSAQGFGLPVTLQHQPFDAQAHYQIPAGMPERISLQTADDLRMALEVVMRAESSNHPLAELKAWRRCLVSHNESLRRRASLVASGTQTNGGRNHTPRVLFVTNQSAYSGAEASLCQLVSQIDGKRFRLFAVVGAEGILTARLREAGIAVTCPGYGFGGTGLEQMIYLSGVISRLRPDIVHLNAIIPREALSMLLLRAIPFVTHYRVSEISAFSEQVRCSSRVVAVSKFCEAEVLRTCVNEARVRVIYNEVDTKKFSPSAVTKTDARRRFAIQPDAFVVLMIARFVPKKRHDLFLRAIKEASVYVPELKVVLNGESYGDDSTLPRVKEYIENNALTNRVEIIPFVEDVRLCHAAADVLVLWSDSEALGRSVVEGMSMGLPVIVANSGGSKELVQEGVTGFVRSSEDTTGLAQLLARLNRDTGHRRRIGLNARLFAEANLDARISAAKMMEIYDSILAESSAGLPQTRTAAGNPPRFSPCV